MSMQRGLNQPGNKLNVSDGVDDTLGIYPFFCRFYQYIPIHKATQYVTDPAGNRFSFPVLLTNAALYLASCNISL